jgi:hypothetical protein
VEAEEEHEATDFDQLEQDEIDDDPDADKEELYEPVLKPCPDSTGIVVPLDSMILDGRKCRFNRVEVG